MKVVGIALVRNEEFFIRVAIENALAFCDEFFVVDNGSTDGTKNILSELKERHASKLRVVEARHPGVSHDLIAGFAGSRTWVLGVDGDEIYDPAGLKVLRGKLEKGEFDRDWCLFGNVLNVRRIFDGGQRASGHLAPPCRSMTKLYNFAAIDAWDGPCQERLHGGQVRFREGYHAGLRHDLHHETSWDDACFRCLHLCFMERSSLDTEGGARKNIMDLHAWTAGKVLRKLGGYLTGRPAPDWKEEKYARGAEVEKDISAFRLVMPA